MFRPIMCLQNKIETLFLIHLHIMVIETRYNELLMQLECLMNLFLLEIVLRDNHSTN